MIKIIVLILNNLEFLFMEKNWDKNVYFAFPPKITASTEWTLYLSLYLILYQSPIFCYYLFIYADFNLFISIFLKLVLSVYFKFGQIGVIN